MLARVASATTDGWSVVSTIFSAIIGGLIAAISQELYRRQESYERMRELLAALQIEVKLNLRIFKEGRDEKLRTYSVSAWEAVRPHVASLRPEAAELLEAGFGAAYMHRRAVEVELVQANQGPTLVSFSEKVNKNFTDVMAMKEWGTRKWIGSA